MLTHSGTREVSLPATETRVVRIQERDSYRRQLLHVLDSPGRTCLTETLVALPWIR